jgi:hypothetical protein
MLLLNLRCSKPVKKIKYESTTNWRLLISDTKINIYNSLDHANEEIHEFLHQKIVAFIIYAIMFAQCIMYEVS